jgi:hypothetical protein
LTFAYTDSAAVLGPLAPRPSPTGLDLCAAHSDSLTVPRGWRIVRLPLDEPGSAAAPGRDLAELADAVRAAAGRGPAVPPPPDALPPSVVTLAERRHLRVVADAARQRARSRVG